MPHASMVIVNAVGMVIFSVPAWPPATPIKFHWRARSTIEYSVKLQDNSQPAQRKVLF